jgi:RNase H-like domain found in reverse transcriptase/Integrase zinc binding domain
MNSKLALCVRLDKAGNKDDTLAEWLDNIKCVDELMCAENANFESISKATRESTRRANTLAEPSCCVNTNNNFVPNNAASSSTSHSVLPKLSSVKRQLLYNNEGCLKCRRVFIQHRSAACPNNFPDATNYKPLTQSFVNLIKKCLGKPLAAVMTSMAETEAVTTSVAVLIAAVMGMSCNPTAYMPSNASSVIEGESDSNMSVSNRNFAAAVANQATSALTVLNEDLAPFTVPHGHLFWHCSINGAANGFPITLSALIDHGSHVVLISDEFTNSLFLKRSKLFEPMSVELAMPAEGPKCIVCLSKWVKLKLYDPSGAWQSKTVRAIIASSLCVPVILGGPFLTHNNIVIDHEHPGENNIFVMCNTSDWQMGATLSFSPTLETARPVAFDSMQLKAAEKNYPVHEKELLAVIHALKKWCSDLLGTHFYIYTDHRTLENFDTQKDLSRHQLRWQEFLSQYDLTMTYIRSEDNTVADALSRLLPNCFADESPMTTATVNAVLKITSDNDILKMIRDGYKEDEFCKRIASSNMKGWTLSNGLWYIGDRLLIPQVTSLREMLFHLAHDTLGHFGADKSYASLRDVYYWPNMCRDLEQAYIPACADCL